MVKTLTWLNSLGLCLCSLSHSIPFQLKRNESLNNDVSYRQNVNLLCFLDVAVVIEKGFSLNSVMFSYLSRGYQRSFYYFIINTKGALSVSWNLRLNGSDYIFFNQADYKDEGHARPRKIRPFAKRIMLLVWDHSFCTADLGFLCTQSLKDDKTRRDETKTGSTKEGKVMGEK